MKMRSMHKTVYALMLALMCMLFSACAMAEDYPESSHPYRKNSNITWTYEHPVETYELYVTFSTSTEFEKGYDFLYITGEDNITYEYTGTELAGKTITIVGDSFTLRLDTDDSENEYGFKITNIKDPGLIVNNGVLTEYTGQGGAITLPKHATQIADSVFSGQTSLTKVTIPDGVTTIGANAFAGCTNLTSINLPASITSIDSTAFSGCSSLTVSVVFNSTGHTWCSSNRIPFVFYSAFESDHPYANSTNKTWTYVHPSDVHILKVAFSSDTEFETNYDYLYITGEDGVEQKYTGTQLQGKKIDVPGSRFTVRLSSNSSNTKNGFSITSIVGLTEAEYEADIFNKSVFTINDAGVITAYTGTASSLAIPASIDGVTVTGIGNSVFYNNTTLTSVTFPDSVTSIGASAFRGSGLTSIDLGENITSVGSMAFYGCPNLKTIKLTNNLTDIGDTAFWCTATSVTVNQTILDQQISTVYNGSYVQVVNFAEGVTDTGSRATVLYGCSNVTAVYLSSTMETIGDMAFYDHASLRSVYNTNSLKTIGKQAFRYCDNLTSFTLPEGLTSMGEYAFADCSLSSIIIPSTLKHVPEHAFSMNDMRSVTIRDGVESLGRYSLNANRFTSVTIPPSVKLLDDSVFYFCQSLKSVTLSEGLETIDDTVFMDCALTEITIPSTVTSIGYNALHSCKALKDVTILSPSIELKSYVFSNCTSLENLTFGGSVTAMDSDAFYGCNTVKNVTFMDGATTIASDFLSGQTNLTTLDLPSTLRTIGSNAFSGCTSLKLAVLPSSLTSIGNGAFSGCSSMTALVKQSSTAHNYCRNNSIPFVAVNDNVSGGNLTASGICTTNIVWTIDETGTMNIYGSGEIPEYYSYTSTPWYSYKNTVTSLIIGEGITHIGNSSFDSFDNVANISLPSTLESISAYAFYGCDALTGITLPQSLKVLDQSSFSSCYNLKSIVLPDGIESIPSTCFVNCNSLSSVTLPANLKSIGSSAFSNTSALTSIVIPDGTQSIDNNAFSYSGLTHVSLPLSIANLGTTAFSNCPSTLTIACHADSYAAQFAETQGILTELEPHTEVILPAVAVTCTTDGLTEGVMCTVCEKTVTEQEIIPAPGHSYGEPVFTWAQDGSACEVTFTCQSCGDVQTPEAAITSEVTLEPDCVNMGETTYTASVTFGEEETVNPENPEETTLQPKVYTDQLTLADIAALGHEEYILPGFPPTCTTSGLTDYIFCEVCEEELQIEEEIPALGHSEMVTQEAIAPTCTEEGRTQEIGCSRCLTTLTFAEPVPALGHSEFTSAEAVDPDCENTGLTEEISCSVCFSVLTEAEIIPALGHTPVPDPAVAPDCVNTGLTEGSHCSVCESVLLAQEVVPALGHSAVTDDAVPPTDYETGLTEGSHCGVCGTVLAAQEILPANFTWDGTTATAYNGTATDVVIPDSTTALGDTLFKGNAAITSVRVPDSVTTLGTQTFYGCTSLTDVWLPGHLTSIGPRTFLNTTAKIHVSAESATAVALSYRRVPFTTADGFTLLYSVSSPTGTPSAVWLTGYHGDSVHLILPETVGGAALTQIEANAFDGCSQIFTLVVPESVTAIGENAFTGCPEVTVWVYPNSAAHTYIVAKGDIPFGVIGARTPAENALKLPSGLKSIDTEAFTGLSVTEVVLPDGCETIAERAFADCAKLKFLYIPASVTEIADDAFDGYTILNIVAPISSAASEYALLHGITWIPSL